MEISYTLLPEDTLAVYSLHFRKQRRVAMLIIFGLLAILALSTFANRNNSDIRLWARILLALINFLLPAIVFLIVLKLIDVWARRATVKHNQTEFCVHTVTLTESALLERTDHNQSQTLWSAIHRIQETEDHILIYLTPGLVHTVPKRAFTTTAEMRRFYDRATTLQLQAHTGAQL